MKRIFIIVMTAIVIGLFRGSNTNVTEHPRTCPLCGLRRRHQVACFNEGLEQADWIESTPELELLLNEDDPDWINDRFWEIAGQTVATDAEDCANYDVVY